MNAAVTAKRWYRQLREVRQRKNWYQRVRDFESHVAITYETDDFLVTTARGGRELLQVLELRHEVFIEEWQGRRAAHGLDVDHYDFNADHLLIIDKRSTEVVGTYRLLSSHFTREFYSAGEFELEDFLRTPEVKLEMGRACVRASHRDGHTLDLLWKGLARYILATRTRFLFGCASLKTEDPRIVSRVYKTLRDDNHWSDQHRVRATWDYQFPGFAMLTPEDLGMTPSERRELIPALLRSYLHAGAKVHGWPALDSEFACTDLLTILDWDLLKPRFQARFIG